MQFLIRLVFLPLIVAMVAMTNFLATPARSAMNVFAIVTPAFLFAQGNPYLGFALVWVTAIAVIPLLNGLGTDDRRHPISYLYSLVFGYNRGERWLTYDQEKKVFAGIHPEATLYGLVAMSAAYAQTYVSKATAMSATFAAIIVAYLVLSRINHEATKRADLHGRTYVLIGVLAILVGVFYPGLLTAYVGLACITAGQAIRYVRL